MSEFHVGDRVHIIGPMDIISEPFVITEFENFATGVYATGEGRAWWPIKDLDYAPHPELTSPQKETILKLERAMHLAGEAIKHAAASEREAFDAGVPGWMIKRVRDAANGA